MTDDARSSQLMAWFRRRFGVLGGIAGAVSHADTGPYGGAPRDPRLRVDDGRAYSAVRYATDHVAYTTTSTNADDCPRCGRPLAEAHRIEQVEGERPAQQVGAVRACRHCQPDSWLLRSRMPAASRSRAAARRHVV